ncbi:MAG: alpha/beta fold hydrolase [Pseudolysinimonas sp.]|uniref:alpha/beta fold hydrolase n=1 Tax=Pseudolysinimonas sp. TaxID=2680009 RepID=UPI0032640C68
MSVPDIRLVPLASGGSGIPLLLGPSLGTRVAAVWDRARPLLAERHPLFGWDLPGHGVSPATTTPFSVDEVAEGLLRAVDAAGLSRVAYAGISLGGIVGLAFALLAPERVTALTLVCSLPKIATPETWIERAAQVRASGTPSLVDATSKRWFVPGFSAEEPSVVGGLLKDLMDVDDESYALCVEALGATDLRSSVRDLPMPYSIIAGAEDPIIPIVDAEASVASARHGSLHVIGRASHLAAVEKPDEVASILLSEVD